MFSTVPLNSKCYGELDVWSPALPSGSGVGQMKQDNCSGREDILLLELPVGVHGIPQGEVEQSRRWRSLVSKQSHIQLIHGVPGDRSRGGVPTPGSGYTRQVRQWSGPGVCGVLPYPVLEKGDA